MNAKEIAQKFVDECNRFGWTYDVRGSILDIHKRLKDGSLESFAKADGEYYHLLSLVPSTRKGSIWGTDGSGVGAISAVNLKLFSMHKSGCSKRVLNALSKMKN